MPTIDPIQFIVTVLVGVLITGGLSVIYWDQVRLGRKYKRGEIFTKVDLDEPKWAALKTIMETTNKKMRLAKDATLATFPYALVEHPVAMKLLTLYRKVRDRCQRPMTPIDKRKDLSAAFDAFYRDQIPNLSDKRFQSELALIIHSDQAQYELVLLAPDVVPSPPSAAETNGPDNQIHESGHALNWVGNESAESGPHTRETVEKGDPVKQWVTPTNPEFGLGAKEPHVPVWGRLDLHVSQLGGFVESVCMGKKSKYFIPGDDFVVIKDKKITEVYWLLFLCELRKNEVATIVRRDFRNHNFEAIEPDDSTNFADITKKSEDSKERQTVQGQAKAGDLFRDFMAFRKSNPIAGRRGTAIS